MRRAPKENRNPRCSAESMVAAAQRAPTWVVVSGLFLFGLALRVGDLDAMVNSDMYYLWSVRTVRFMRALQEADFANTYQSHHPGVTLMWIVGLVWWAFDLLRTPIQLHPEKIQIAVWPIVLFGSWVAAATYPLLKRLLGHSLRSAGFFAAALLASEPLWIAHSRNSHLDVLATGFAWLAILSALIAKREHRIRWAIGCGLLLGLALLSKISTAGYALGIAAVYLYDGIRRPSTLVRQSTFVAIIATTAALTVLTLWPALLTFPVTTLLRWHHGLLNEVSKAIPFMLFGTAGKLIVPSWVYGVFIAFLVTPEFYLPGIVGCVFLAKTQRSLNRFLLELLLVTLPLAYLVMSSNNVGLRNIILVLPILATLTGLVVVYAWRWLYSRIPHRAVLVAISVLLLVGTGRVARIVALYPLPITYCSGWLGVDCAEVFHVGWGEGMKEAAAFIARYAKERQIDSSKLSVYGSGYAPIVRVWTPVAVSKTVEQADLLIDYAPDWQRKGDRAKAISSYTATQGLLPLHEVILNERSYVKIYRGPHLDLTTE